MAKLKKRFKVLIALGCVAAAIFIVAMSFYFHFLSAHKIKVWSPAYEAQDISAILEKQTLSDEDYEILYAQTGLTKIGVDRAMEKGSAGKSRIINIQKSYFKTYEVKKDSFAPYVCTDYIEEYIPNTYIEPGDIVVTSSTHIAGFRVGHAGLVTSAYPNATNGFVLQASQIGATSDFGDMRDFTDRCNFMVFRPDPEKISGDEVEKICEYAAENLTGLTYFPAAGVLSKKSNEKLTQCAHVVWSAYKKYGYDLDSNGGAVVTPKNLASSPYLQLVQVFGFDPQKLWD